MWAAVRRGFTSTFHLPLRLIISAQLIADEKNFLGGGSELAERPDLTKQ